MKRQQKQQNKRKQSRLFTLKLVLLNICFAAIIYFIFINAITVYTDNISLGKLQYSDQDSNVQRHFRLI